MTAAEQFVAAARELKGARWRHLGRKPWAVDCIGLLALSFARCGVTFEDERFYSMEPIGDALRQGAIRRWGQPLPRTAARVGDIVLIRWGGPPTHVGIVADHPDGGLSVIHAGFQGVLEQGFRGILYAATTDVFRPWGQD